MYKLMITSAAVVLILLNLALVQACSTTPVNDPTLPPFSAADEAKYLQRFEALREAIRTTGNVPPYDNLEPVIGATDYEPLPRNFNSTAISQDALDDALAYAEVNNSASFIVWHKGEIIAEKYFGDITADSLLTSYSLAKPISVASVGTAIQNGLVENVDIPVTNHLPEWKDTDKSKIQLNHFLSMSSGLLPQALATTADDILNRAYLHPRHTEVILHEYPLTDEPGSRYEYSNANGEIIALILERATKQRYGDWVGDSLLKPIGAKGGEVFVNRPGGTAHSGCCMLLPAESYLRLAILVLQDGIWNNKRILPEGYVERISSPSPNNKYTGMGIYLGHPYVERRGYANHETTPDNLKVFHSEPYLADDLVLFDGNRNQVVYIIPSKELVILRTALGRARTEPEWDNTYLPNTILRGMN